MCLLFWLASNDGRLPQCSINEHRLAASLNAGSSLALEGCHVLQLARGFMLPLAVLAVDTTFVKCCWPPALMGMWHDRGCRCLAIWHVEHHIMITGRALEHLVCA